MCIRDRDIPDFSNWCLSRAHRSSISHISAFWQGRSHRHRCLSIMHSFSVTSANIAISDTSLNTRSFGLHFCYGKYRCIFNHFYVMGAEIYRIRWKKGKVRAIAPFKVFKITDFRTNWKLVCDFPLVINSNIYPSCTVSKLRLIIRQADVVGRLKLYCCTFLFF